MRPPLLEQPILNGKKLNPVANERIYRVICVLCWVQGVDEVWCMPASVLVLTAFSHQGDSTHRPLWADGQPKKYVDTLETS